MLINIILKKIKNLININEADINKIFLSNKAPYGEQGCYKYYIGYLGGIGFKPLHILIKKQNYMSAV